FVRSLLPLLGEASAVDVLILPPYTSLDRLGRILEGTEIALGAQDLHFEATGAYTGAVSSSMLAACGCRYVLVGHSERRHVFGDDDATVARKLHAALGGGLLPILCVGERLEERRAGETESVLVRQLSSALADVTSGEMARITIAYEPVWAIGTGETATPQQAQQACATIREWLASRYDDGLAKRARILYGGSVKPDNASLLLDEPDIDGALIGGASLDAEVFARILDAARKLGGEA
ncbi:triose-phosphate isomerase, partial [Candidatus Bipolaricaulota bacterium]|nr:triose-phosphate isomerase [Candidatus Bipolaricaulota bacterium]